MKFRKGFTLTELLVVIAIIGLLSAAGFFSLNLVKARARDSIRVADMDQFSKALDLYTNSTGAYPIVEPNPVCLDGTDVVSLALEGAGYINSTFADPIFTDNTKCYRYVSDTDGTSFAIQYFLETNAIESKGKGFHTAPY